MQSHLVSELADHVLIRDAVALVAVGRSNTAALLVHLAEIEARRLYAAEHYPSMFAWCVGELHLSRDAAYRRLRAAGAARKFPALLPAIVDGRLHLSAIVLLAPCLTAAHVDDLIAAATHKDREAIETLLAQRFPSPDVPTELRPIPTPGASGLPLPLAPAPARERPIECGAASVAAGNELPTSGPGDARAPKVALAPLAPPVAPNVAPPMVPPAPYARLTPLAPGRFALRGTLDQKTHDLLREAQALLGNAIPSGDLMQVLERVLEEWVAAYRRRHLAATDSPRPRRSAAKGRYVPAEIKRAVRKRDGERCTFVSAKGRRCEARKCLQFDHVLPVARGGRTTADNLRLRCRLCRYRHKWHYAASGFMPRWRPRAAGPCVIWVPYAA